MSLDNKTQPSAPELKTAVADFCQWFEQEKANGLVDIKFCLANLDTATVAKVLHGVNVANKMIAAGIVEPDLEA